MTPIRRIVLIANDRVTDVQKIVPTVARQRLVASLWIHGS
jgi:hypothetical protein